MSQSPYDGSPEGALVHQGFYNAWIEAAGEVVAEVARLSAQFPVYAVACVGHSLGAALAVHCTADLRQRGIEAVAYTYGQPRVGNDIFSAWYESVDPGSLRVTAYGDIVPHVPPQALDYRFQPTELFLNATGALVVCDASGEDPTCSNGVPVSELDQDAHTQGYFDVVFGACYLA